MEISNILLRPIEQPEMITYARENIPLHGVLKQTKGGYVYLKVDDQFIRSLFPLLNTADKQIPPYFTDFYNNVGAHITVIYQDEQSSRCMLDELDTSVSFTLNKLYHAVLEFNTYFILTVESIDLENIRKKYGFSDKPVYHGIPIEWHITIAQGLWEGS